MKFRVKLKNGRVIGPFSVAQVGELFHRGHIDGSEECQLFPVGEWAPLKNHEPLKNELKRIIAEGEVQSTPASSATVVNLNLSKNKLDNSPEAKEQAVSGDFNEFDYSSEVEEKPDYLELEEKHQRQQAVDIEMLYQGDLDSPAEEKKDVDTPPDDQVNKTVFIKPKAHKAVDLDKTIVTPASVAFKEEQQRKQQEEERKAAIKVEHEKMHPVIPIEEEKTQMIDLNQVLPDLKALASEAEKELVQKEEEQLKLKAEEAPSVSQAVASVAKRKGFRPIMALVFVLLIGYLLFTNDEKATEKPIVPIWADIHFPISKEFENIAASNEAYRKGMEMLSRKTYESKLKAVEQLSLSLQHKFSDNPALGQLIYLYSDLIGDVKDRDKAIATIYKLVEIGRSKLLTDVNVAMGSALFYRAIGKPHTGLNILENFLRVGQPNIQFLVTYLNLLIDVGKLIDAEKAYKKLSEMENPPFEGYLAMARYLTLEEKHEEANKVLVEASEKYSKSVLLLLNYADYLLRQNDIKRFVSSLKAIKILEAERSPVYYSKYLEFMGMLSALQKDNASAVALFKEALKISESKELRSKLASLELGGSKAVENLILESKVVELMRKARIEATNRNWDKAFSYAIDAADMIDSYVPSKLLLARIQIERGFYKASISTLEKLHNEFPLDGDINFLLVEAYVAAQVFDKAQNLINKISSTKLIESYYYPSMLAHFFDAKDNLLVAVSWYKKSLALNPLNDAEFYSMAKLLLRHNKLKDVNTLIKKAITLDPENIDYLMIYAQVLYEFNGSNEAIGYLRSILERHPDQAQVRAQIAIFYHKSGQIKSFEREAQEILSSSKVDSSFYAYMIDSSILNEKQEDMIRYSKEYIKLNPGDLKRRMTLGAYFLEHQNYDEAVKAFKEIIERLPNYPKTNYYLAKIAMLQGDYKTSLQYADLERQYTPHLEYGYFIAGETLRRAEKYGEAIKMLEQAVARNANSVEALMSLAWIKSRQRFFDEAKEYYLRALKQEPGNLEAHKEIAYTYKAMGQSKLAIESFNVYLELDPNASDKAKILQEINLLK